MIDNKTIREVVIDDKLFPGGSGGPTYDTRTASGAIATFNTNVVKPLRSLTAQIVPIQEGTGDPSPSNPRPISGTSVLDIYHSGADTSNPTTYPIALGRTVYGGSAEVVDGTGEETYVIFDFGSEDLTWSYNAGQTRFYCTIPNIDLPTAYGVVADILCSCYKTVKFTDVTGTQTDDIIAGVSQSGTNYITCRDTRFTDAQTFKANLTGQKILLKLATPTAFTFTGQEINSLLGVNNIWHDANGTTEATYLYQTGEGGSKVNKWLPIFYPIRKGDT